MTKRIEELTPGTFILVEQEGEKDVFVVTHEKHALGGTPHVGCIRVGCIRVADGMMLGITDGTNVEVLSALLVCKGEDGHTYYSTPEHILNEWCE